MSSPAEFATDLLENVQSSQTPPQAAQANHIPLDIDTSSRASSSEEDEEVMPPVDIDQDSNERVVAPEDRSYATPSPQIFQRDSSSLPDDPYAEEPSYYIRPNRYHGPASTWRDWTKQDRAVAESIDRQRASNLSAHLYNAHSLSVRARDLETRRSNKARARAASTNDEDGIGDKSFVPPKVWTAWPLPPNEVDRTVLAPRIGKGEAFRGLQGLRASAELEDCFVATVQKIAREHWDARGWHQPGSEERGGKYNYHDGDTDHRPNLYEGKIDAQSQARADLSLSPEPDRDFELDPKAISDGYEESGADDETNQVMENTRPVTLADDEKARQLLLPSTRHILSKFDELLLGLHKARLSYATRVSDDGDIGFTTDEATDTGATSSTNKSRNRKPRKRLRISPVGTADVDQLSRSTSTQSSRRQRKTRQTYLGMRDWSDIMGMAALTGWDVKVVERASERCTGLFGENMLFRTFWEGDGDEKSYYTERFATGDEPASGSGEDLETESSTARPAIQERGICQVCYNQDFECEYQGPGPCRLCSENSWKCVPYDRSRPALACPYSFCDRHERPFTRMSHLRRHIQRVHRNDPDPVPADLEDIQAQERSQVRYCPVKTCERHSVLPFSRGANLYEHVRRMHPEVQVEELKRIETERRAGKRFSKRNTSKKSNVTSDEASE